jgi:two-component system, OmpR family, sensor histidine kinase KdpD
VSEAAPRPPLRPPHRGSGPLAYLGAGLLVVATTGLGAATSAYLDVPDVEMLYVLAVLVSAVFLGKGPAILAAAVGVLAYDYLFVPPVYTLDVAEPRYLFTFAMMLGIGVAVSSLAERARNAAVRAEAEALRGTLLSSVSHDLRTPLASITGAATTLRDQAVDEATRRELVAAICEESERMGRLVTNLLDMTRLSSGTVTARREWVPVEEIVGSALARTEAALARHLVRTDVPSGSLLAHADPVLLEQLLVNLLENTARHTPPGTEVLVRARGADGGLDLEVADRGPGLPPGDEELVFERFHRAGRTAGQGAGLGLAIARAIAAVHGGTLRASNRADGGAAFRLVLPATGLTPPPPPEPEAAPRPGKDPP